MANISAIKLPDGITYNIVDKISGYITVETDPVFTASPAYGISASDIAAWNGKQAALVSGTNIKTINNTSILGSGNITIQGGSGITTLTSPIRPETLDDGLYLIPGNSTFEFYLLDLILPHLH